MDPLKVVVMTKPQRKQTLNLLWNGLLKEKDMFKLDERLLADGPILDTLFADHVIISKRGSQYPWLVVVPKVADACEIFDLKKTERDYLFFVVNHVAKALKQATGADKINIECIGNVCSQLHVHVIARFITDDTWPAPVWNKPFKAKDLDEEATIARVLEIMKVAVYGE